MYSGITSGRVLNGELLYTKILEVNLFAFAYRLFRRDFSPLDGTYCTKILEVNLFAFAYRLFRRDFSPLDGTYCNMSRRVGRNLYETVYRQMQTN